MAPKLFWIRPQAGSGRSFSQALYCPVPMAGDAPHRTTLLEREGEVRCKRWL